MSNKEEISKTSEISITSREEAQDYMEAEARRLLPSAVEKLSTAVDMAAKPKEIIEVVDTLRSYAQVKKTSDNATVAAGAAMGIALSGEAFASAFSGMSKIFGVEGNEESLKNVSSKFEVIEKVEKMEVLDEIEKDKSIKEDSISQGDNDEDKQPPRTPSKKEPVEQNPIRF